MNTVRIRGRRYRYGMEDGPELVAAAIAYLQASFVRESGPVNGPEFPREFLSLKLIPYEAEVFAVMFLDTRHRLIKYREMFHGTIDGALVHPREVVRAALDLNAAAVILGHNHPSGNAEPSMADIAITERLRDALSLIDVRVLDHIVVGAEGNVSMSEKGLI